MFLRQSEIEMIHDIDLPSEPSKLYGHISTQVHLVDYKTNTRRTGLLSDVVKGIALVKKWIIFIEVLTFQMKP